MAPWLCEVEEDMCLPDDWKLKQNTDSVEPKKFETQYCYHLYLHCHKLLSKWQYAFSPSFVSMILQLLGSYINLSQPS